MAAFGWSVGDIVASINFIVTSIDAVKDSTGSAAEYRAVSTTLSQVASTLESLNKLKIEDAADRQAIHAAASQCGEAVFQFINKIEKFKLGLGTRNSFWKLAATVRKIEWALYTRKDLQQFHTQLLANLATLNLVLLRVIESLSEARAVETQTALIRVERKIDYNSAMQLFLIQTLQHCFSGFQNFLILIFTGHMQIISNLYSGSRISQMPEETPIYIDDPNHRILRFLRSSIRDWDDFETLLKLQFKREAGFRKVSAGEYALHDPQQSTDIVKSMPVERVFLPGKKFTMSMIFELARHVNNCPRCPDSTVQCSDLEMKCNTCGLIFSKRRDTEVENEIRSTGPDSSASSYETTPSPNPFTEREYSSQYVTCGPVPPPESIDDFNRVRIIENLSILKYKVTAGEASTQKTTDPV